MVVVFHTRFVTKTQSANNVNQRIVLQNSINWYIVFFCHPSLKLIISLLNEEMLELFKETPIKTDI